MPREACVKICWHWQVQNIVDDIKVLSTGFKSTFPLVFFIKALFENCLQFSLGLVIFFSSLRKESKEVI